MDDKYTHQLRVLIDDMDRTSALIDSMATSTYPGDSELMSSLERRRGEIWKSIERLVVVGPNATLVAEPSCGSERLSAAALSDAIALELVRAGVIRDAINAWTDGIAELIEGYAARNPYVAWIPGHGPVHPTDSGLTVRRGLCGITLFDFVANLPDGCPFNVYEPESNVAVLIRLALSRSPKALVSSVAAKQELSAMLAEGRINSGLCVLSSVHPGW